MQRISKPVRPWIVLCAAAALGLAACADVPQEAAEPSGLVSQGMAEPQWKHRDRAMDNFDRSRQTINNFIDNTYSPALTRKALTRRVPALGNKTFVEHLRDTAAVPDNTELRLMRGFVRRQMRETEARRRELLDPLEQRRREYMAVIDVSCQPVQRGYSAVAGHLASICQVQVSQDKTLTEVGAGGFCDKITVMPNRLSCDIARITDEAEIKADGIGDAVAKVQVLREGLDKLKQRITNE